MTYERFITKCFCKGCCGKKCGETNLIMAYFHLCKWGSEKSLWISKRFKVPEFVTYAIAEVPY